jgi:cardiolipin synthase
MNMAMMLVDLLQLVPYLTFLADLLIRIGLSVRVIMRRLPVGISLAWLAIILVFPFAGAVLYLLIGEYRLGPGRNRRAEQYRKAHHAESVVGLESERFDTATLGGESGALARLAESTFGSTTLAGNHLQMLKDSDAAFPQLIADIDHAKRNICLEFYIWSNGGRADDLGAALIRAARRGVACRVLVDAFGSKAFLKSARSKELRENGCKVQAALPSGPLQLLLVRPDLRMHRKIAVIDGAIGYTGSMNVADPLLFKRNLGIGPWVDAMVRVHGPIVRVLAEIFREDWFLESGELLEPASPVAEAPNSPGPSNAAIQALASGPGLQVEAIEQVLLMALYGARKEAVLTTPYFVPSESLLTALLSAVGRGVEVILIVPERVDSRLVQFASRAFQIDMLNAGLRVALYQGGMLHTKSVTIDGNLSLFGSLNLDPRSLRLDLEITLAVYDREFAAAVRALQQFYIDGSRMLDLATVQARSPFERFAENTARLVGPIL